jgi:hypothetical protein
MTAFTWSDEQIQILLACESDADFLNAFPGKPIETLKRAKRRFRQANLALDASDGLSTNRVIDIPLDTPKGWAAGVEVTGDKGIITTGPVTEPVEDWSDTLKIWGLDPEKFEVVGPLTFKAWDMGAKDSEGNLQSKRMFSFKARIQRVVQTEQFTDFDFAEWQEQLKTAPALAELGDDNPSTYVICIADPQLGKPGTQEALASWKTGVLNHIAKLQAIRRLEAVERILVAFMGDEHEGVAGFYANQQYEVELSLSKQLELDFDMRAWTIKTVAEVGLPVTVVSVISNHGEFTRQNGKVVTSPGDNSSTMVARLVKKLYDGTDYDIEWEIADENPDVVLQVSGTKVLFSHGHVASGAGKSSEFRTKNAYEKQILGRTAELGDVTLFVTAHYHHHSLVEHQGRTYLGCPALEAEKSSKWFFNKHGAWSKPGMLGFLAGARFGDRGWAALDVM